MGGLDHIGWIMAVASLLCQDLKSWMLWFRRSAHDPGLSLAASLRSALEDAAMARNPVASHMMCRTLLKPSATLKLNGPALVSRLLQCSSSEAPVSAPMIACLSCPAKLALFISQMTAHWLGCLQSLHKRLGRLVEQLVEQERRGVLSKGRTDNNGKQHN